MHACAHFTGERARLSWVPEPVEAEAEPEEPPSQGSSWTPVPRGPGTVGPPGSEPQGWGSGWRKRGWEAAGATDHRLSQSPLGSQGRAEQALREEVDSGKADEVRSRQRRVLRVLKQSPQSQHQQPGPGPVHQPNHQEPSPNFCAQDLHTASPGLTQLLLRRAPNHQRTSLSALSPGCTHPGAFSSWVEVLSSRLQVLRLQVLGSRVQRLNSRSQIQNTGSSL